MDVLVCGAQSPFVTGGAELATRNLVRALQDEGHRADLVQLPVAWEKDRIFDSALAWRMIPADADLVIATNFPSYYIRHERKIVWLFHQHRGAYDAVDAAWSDFGPDDPSVEVQRQLTEWDRIALGEARRIYTLSDNVSDRLTRFNGLHGQALYHPPPLHDALRPGEFGDYIFAPMRLESNKRPDRLVSAIVAATSGARGIIAGRGGMADELRAQAAAGGAADRLTLTGFVSDGELIELFAGALAVLYAPHDEDYGYVTLQAFRAGKPVITASDSGGVLEWVQDGVNGIITDGSPEQLGAAVDRLRADPDLARAMGEQGRRRVADLEWTSVVRALLAP